MIKIVLFDLDNTLFDHYHSLRSAISAVQDKYSSLAGRKREDLIDRYNSVLQRVYDKYLSKEVMYEETDILKVRLFFAELGLPELGLEEAREFRAIYKQAYRKSRRATPGAVETLVRLREHGYRLAIVSNGQVEDQEAKAEAIKIRHLVDSILTSEEAGCCKPDRRIFEFAIKALGEGISPLQIHMVGDSADSDIRGAFNAGLNAVLYSPISKESQRLLFGKEVPVITHMSQLLQHLGVKNPLFEPHFVSRSCQLIIEGIGIDLVTEPRHSMRISREIVHFLAENMGQVLVSVSEKRYLSAMSSLEGMIRAIAKVVMSIDETAIQISYPGQSQLEASVAQPECRFTIRDHSIRAEYTKITLAADSENEAVLRNIAILLQIHCNDLMRDCPRASVSSLRSAVLILAEKASIKSDTVIKGTKVDE